MKVTTIVVQKNPKLDLLVGIWLLKNFGEEKFPGIKTATITVSSTCNKPEFELVSGRLLLGFGGGMFDNHGTTKKVTELVFDVIKPSQKGLSALIRGMINEDARLQLLSEQVRDLNRYWAGSVKVEKLYALIDPFLRVIVMRQAEYAEARIFALSGKVGWSEGNGVKFVIARTDNPQFQCAARNLGAKIIVQRNECGKTQVFGSPDLDMANLTVRIRRAEISIGKIRASRFLNEKILAEPSVEEVPQWYYDVVGNNLFNGTETFDAPSSVLGREDFHGVIRKFLLETVEKPKAVEKEPASSAESESSEAVA